MKEQIKFKFNIENLFLKGSIYRLIKKIGFNKTKIKYRSSAYYQNNLINWRYNFCQEIYSKIINN